MRNIFIADIFGRQNVYLIKFPCHLFKIRYFIFVIECKATIEDITLYDIFCNPVRKLQGIDVISFEKMRCNNRIYYRNFCLDETMYIVLKTNSKLINCYIVYD